MEPLFSIGSTRCVTITLVFAAMSPVHAQDRMRTTHLNTRWDIGASYMSNYHPQDMVHPDPGDMESRTKGSAWRAEFGYRPAKWGTLVLAFDRAMSKHGWNENNTLISSTTVSSLFFGSTITNVYEADLLTLGHTVSTVSLLQRVAVRPYPRRRRIAFALQAAWGLRLHHVAAELGVAANERYTVSDNLFMDAFGYEPAGPSWIALSYWDDRHVVHRSSAMGASLALELRPELYCTRSVSLFADVDFTVALAEPRFAAYAINDEGLEQPAYRINLSGVRAGMGAAVHF